MPSSSKPLALSIALFAAACGPAVAPADGTGGASTGPVVSDETTAALPSSPPPPSDSSESTDGALDDGSLDDGAVDGDSGSSSAGASFLPDPDGGLGYQCDLLTQDCPPGEKCVPWANDGGTTWNAYRCSPIDADPGEPGDPCTVEVSPTSGIDDCELGTMCWNVDPRTNTGVCVALCTGDLAAPICEDPQTHCAISGVGVLALCLPTCHPFVQDCAENEGCYPNSDHWECHPSTATAAARRRWGNSVVAGGVVMKGVPRS